MTISRAAIIAEARTWIGTPYRHQGSLCGIGCDCLGLLRGLWRGLIGPEPEQPDPYSRGACNPLFSPYSSSTAKMAGAMRIFLIAMTAAACGAAAALLAPLQSSAAQLAPLQCLTTDETREEIASARLVQPFVLMRRAAGETHAEAIDGRLCRWNNELIYEISLLRRDGHIVRVHFNAADGKAVERR